MIEKQSTTNICLFIPTFQVASSILKVLHQIPQECLQLIQNIIIIDNGSTDGTIDLIKSFISTSGLTKILLFQNDENYSLGGSTILAFQIARKLGADFLICMHSDGQADPNDLSKFIEYSKSDIDFVFGSRLQEGSDVSKYPLLRLYGNQFFSYLQKITMGCPVKDIGAYISFNLNTVFSLPFDQIPHDMGYQPILILLAFKKLPKIQYKEFPIHWGAPENSSINIWIYGLKHLYRIILIGINSRKIVSKKRAKLITHEVISHPKDNS